MARPKKKPSERFEESIRLRMRTADLDLIREAASRAGLPISGWARTRLLEAARTEVK